MHAPERLCKSSASANAEGVRRRSGKYSRVDQCLGRGSGRGPEGVWKGSGRGLEGIVADPFQTPFRPLSDPFQTPKTPFRPLSDPFQTLFRPLSDPFQTPPFLKSTQPARKFPCRHTSLLPPAPVCREVARQRFPSSQVVWICPRF